MWRFKSDEYLVPSGFLILGGDLVVLQTPIFDGRSFDPFSMFDDGFRPAEVDIGGRYVVQALWQRRC